MHKRKKHKFLKDAGNKDVSQCEYCRIWRIKKDGSYLYKRPDGMTDNTNTATYCFKLSKT